MAGVILLATAAALLVHDRQMSSPAHTVKAYYDALAARDAELAKALLAPGYDGNGQADAALLTTRVLRDPGYHPPRDVRLELMDLNSPDLFSHPNPEDAVVLARYTAAGRSYQQQLRLIPHDGETLKHKWRISDPLLPLEVPREMGAVLVAGTRFRADGRSVVAFPGAYTVTLPGQKFVHTEAVLLAGPTDRVPFTPALTEGGRAEIERQVRAYIDSCVTGTGVKPEDCPFRDPVDPYAGLISPRIVKYPKVRIETGSWGELLVTTVEPGQVEFTPRTSPATSQRATTDFTVVGRARFTGDTLTFTRN